MGDRREYDVLLDRVIKVTEDNLRAQSEYLQKLNEIKARFDLNDRDHQDVKQSLTHITNNTFEMLNKMNKVSNEEILDQLEEQGVFQTRMSTKFEAAMAKLTAIDGKLDNLTPIVPAVGVVQENTIDINKAFATIQKLLAAILIASVGIQIVATAWKSAVDTNTKEAVADIIQEEIKKAKK
jgi:hypothetical protein